MEGASTGRPATRALPVVLGAVAVSALIRYLVARDLQTADPLVRVPVLDDGEYIAMARAMGEGRAEAWFFAPLYPWLVAAASRIGTLAMPLACSVNVALGAAATGVAAAAGCALHSRAAGAIAAVLHALAGVYVFQDSIPGQESALTLLHLTALVLAIHLTRRPSAWVAALLGLTIGVAMLGRSVSAALLLCAVPVLAAAGARVRVRTAAVIAAALLAVLVPAALRNHVVAGDLSPFTWARGPNLYAANGPDSRATVSFWASELSSKPAEMPGRALSIARTRAGSDLTLGEVSAWWTSRAWNERGSAGAFALHTLRKAAVFWAAEERGSIHSLAAEREFSGLLTWLPSTAWWLLAAGAASWWLLRTRVPVADGVALAIAGTWVLLTVAFPLSRYRLPVAATAAVLVAAASVEIARRAVPRRRMLQAAAVFGLVTVVAFLPIRERSDGVAHVNVATGHLQAGDGVAAAKARLLRAVEVEPGCGPAHEYLGRIRFEEGDSIGAYEHFAVAAQDRRTRFSAQVAALPALVALNRLDEASVAAGGLLGERRDDPELLANAALVEWALGNRMEAATLLAAARRIAPGHPSVRRAGAATGF